MSNETTAKIGLLDQFQIALYASKDKRLSACDLACLFEIVDRFLKDKGMTRPTGKAHLERETGRSNGSIKESIRRLTKWEYIAVATGGKGTRGNEYIPNFSWAHHIAEVVMTEVRDRAAAKRKYRSGAENCPTSPPKLVGRNSAPLRNLVGQPTALLDVLDGRNSAPQTYVSPAGGDYVGSKSAPGVALGLAASAARASSVKLKVSHASLDKNDGKTLLYIVMVDEAGDDIEDRMFLEHRKQSEQDSGILRFQQLLDAAGLAESPTEISELVGLSLEMADDDYVPANQPWKRQAMGLAA